MKIDTKKLDIAIARACLTVDELSKQSKVNIVTLTRVRRGLQEPMPKTVEKLAKALKVDAAELV